MNVEQRLKIEARVVRHLMRTAKRHGYRLVRVFDGEEYVKTTTEREVLDAVFSVDISTIFFKHPEEPKGHCAVIVLGNDGWDCVADASTGGLWDAVLEENSIYSESVCEAYY
jgi:hypothetical protein